MKFCIPERPWQSPAQESLDVPKQKQNDYYGENYVLADSMESNSEDRFR